MPSPLKRKSVCVCVLRMDDQKQQFRLNAAKRQEQIMCVGWLANRQVFSIFTMKWTYTKHNTK